MSDYLYSDFLGYDKYGDYTPVTIGGNGGNESFNTDCPYGFGRYTAERKTWTPPLPYISGQPAIPPTPTQIRRIKNSGWNSWARSIAELQRGEFYDFNCATGIEGCCIGIGPVAFLGKKLPAFEHSISIDQSGIKIQEFGEVVSTVVNFQAAGTIIRIYRQPDDTLIYCTVTDSDVVVYEGRKYRYPSAFVFGYLYSSDDQILTSSYKGGTVHFGSA